MKISNNESLRAGQVSSITPAPRVAATPQNGPTGTTGTPAAEVQLSSQAQTLSAAMQAVNAAPETRDDLVTKLQKQISDGTYKVSGADIADQMVRRAQADRIR
ncbi:MAG: flagellar biosynthesis anti-sigma factor FlgM [Capsulimonas sp.]|uniref:flagellar biosynthesis anti-sigma factor FlgM n=1 Tax=Capsulimonas sp. TaxID=2494211 RepID=UPI003263B4A9